MKRLVLLLFIITALPVCAQTFSAKDIEGKWQSTKKDSELFIEISGSEAEITSVGKTTMTPKIVGGNMYDNIVYKGNGQWSGRRIRWVYNGVNRVNQEDGEWVIGENLTLTLSADKQTLSASGHWSYKRVGAKPVGSVNTATSTTTTKQVVTEDFGGVTGKFHLVDKPKGGDFIVAQLTNTTQGQTAIVLIKTDDGELHREFLNPGNTLTKKFDSKTIELQITYQTSTTARQLDMVGYVKEVVRKMVTNNNGDIEVTPIGSIGVRG